MTKSFDLLGLVPFGAFVIVKQLYKGIEWKWQNIVRLKKWTNHSSSNATNMEMSFINVLHLHAKK